MKPHIEQAVHALANDLRDEGAAAAHWNVFVDGVRYDLIIIADRPAAYVDALFDLAKTSNPAPKKRGGAP